MNTQILARIYLAFEFAKRCDSGDGGNNTQAADVPFTSHDTCSTLAIYKRKLAMLKIYVTHAKPIQLQTAEFLLRQTDRIS